MIDYNRIQYLKDKVESKLATKKEEEEYMELLHKMGQISDSTYSGYLKSNEEGKDSSLFTAAAVFIGGTMLIGYLLKKAFSSK
jgi:hypothetical protein